MSPEEIDSLLINVKTLNELFKIHQEHIEFLNKTINEVIRRQNVLIDFLGQNIVTDFLAEKGLTYPKKQTKRYRSFHTYK